MAFGFNRNLGVILSADTKRLERGLDRANAKVAAFGKSVGSAKGGLGASIIGGKAGLAFLGGGAVAIGLTRTVNAAKEAEIVLGQTSVAVDDAGLSWQQSGAEISAAADRISRATAFDDEEVLKSFQVFVRGQKDVKKSLELSGLAADVARGRYTDLESATQLVNKAAMGQIGALRRAGIAIDKNASSTEALAALQKAYGGAAEKYADSAAGASDRLAVAWENLAEQAGGTLVPALTDVTNGLAGVLEKMGSIQATSKDLLDKDFRDKFVDAFGADKLFEILNQTTSAGLASRPDEGSRGPKAPGSPDAKAAARNNPNWRPVLTLEQKLRLARDKASSTDFLKDDLAAARALLAFYMKEENSARTTKARFAAAQEVVAAQQDIASVQQQIADRAKADRLTSKARLAKAAKDAKKASDSLGESLREQAEGFKDAILSALDRKQDNLDTSRAVADAKAALKQARVLGGPEAIKLAMRDVQDAQIERQRYLVEGGQVTANKNGTFNFAGAQFHFHGVKDVKAFMAEMRKAAGSSAKSTTGLGAGYHALR